MDSVVFVRIGWGECERAPHRRVCCKFSIHLYIILYRYISIVHRAVNLCGSYFAFHVHATLHANFCNVQATLTTFCHLFVCTRTTCVKS